MYLIFYILLILLSLLHRKNKRYASLVIVFSLIIVYMHPYCADYLNYENVYNIIAKGYKYFDTGIGWYYVCYIFSRLGISFRLFKTIICGISLLLINHTVKEFLDGKNKNYFLAISLIFPFLIQFIQFRFFLATSIIVFNYKNLSEKNVKKIFLSIFSLTIASLIHSSYFFFLIIYLILLINPLRKHIKIALVVIFTLTVCLILYKNVLIELVSHFINVVRINRYFTVKNEKSNILYMFLSFIAIYINYKPLSLIIKNGKINNISDENAKNAILTVNKLSLLSVLLIPLMTFDVNFIRVLQLPIILSNISLLICKTNQINDFTLFRKKIKIWDALFLNSIFYFIIFIPKLLVFWGMLK